MQSVNLRLLREKVFKSRKVPILEFLFRLANFHFKSNSLNTEEKTNSSKYKLQHSLPYLHTRALVAVSPRRAPCVCCHATDLHCLRPADVYVRWSRALCSALLCQSISQSIMQAAPPSPPQHTLHAGSDRVAGRKPSAIAVHKAKDTIDEQKLACLLACAHLSGLERHFTTPMAHASISFEELQSLDRSPLFRRRPSGSHLPVSALAQKSSITSSCPFPIPSTVSTASLETIPDSSKQKAACPHSSKEVSITQTPA
jgi:hypothetical protein